MRDTGLDPKSFGRRLVRFLAFAGLLCSASSVFGSIHTPRDPRLGVLDADLIALIRPTDKDAFQVEEVYLGHAELGEVVTLPGFKLVTQEEDKPTVIDPFTADTTVLVYLAKATNGEYKITFYGECYFWVQSPERVNELRTMALDSVAMRRSWEDARDTPDVNKRIDALWPFLWDHNIRFWERTSDELKKIGAPAGDYIAGRLESMTDFQRMFFLADMPMYGGTRSHALLRDFVVKTRDRVETMLKSGGILPGFQNETKWPLLDRPTADAVGELYYGLAGLVGFKNRADLPFIREMATWAAGRSLEQTCEAALRGFEFMPDKANLPYIATISQMFSAHYVKGYSPIPFDVARALIAHPYGETVPLLTPFLDDDFSSETVYQNLKRITGQDLGRKPAPWLEWYQKTISSPKPK